MPTRPPAGTTSPRWAGPACWRPNRPAASRWDWAAPRRSCAHAAPEPLLAVAGLGALLLSELHTPRADALLAELVAGRSLPALAWQESAGDLSAVPLACGCEALAGDAGGVLLQGE